MVLIVDAVGLILFGLRTLWRWLRPTNTSPPIEKERNLEAGNVKVVEHETGTAQTDQNQRTPVGATIHSDIAGDETSDLEAGRMTRKFGPSAGTTGARTHGPPAHLSNSPAMLSPLARITSHSQAQQASSHTVRPAAGLYNQAVSGSFRMMDRPENRRPPGAWQPEIQGVVTSPASYHPGYEYMPETSPTTSLRNSSIIDEQEEYGVGGSVVPQITTNIEGGAF